MQHLDGNVLAGPLAELFAFEPTMASARCAGCGTVAMLAQASVWVDAERYVVRCGDCDSVLATIMSTPDRTWLSLAGITALEISR
jgi:uncharacterized Zn finger protein